MTLSLNTLAASAGLAQVLVERELHLVPRLGTPLAALCEFTTTGSVGDEPHIDLYERSKTVDAEGRNLHGAVMAEQVKEFKARAARTLQLARHIVVPEMQNAVAQAQAILDSRRKAVGSYDIEQVEREPLLSDSVIQDRMGRYLEVEASDLTTGEIANLTGEELIKLASSSLEVDGMLKAHIDAGTLDINQVLRTFTGLTTLDMLNVPELVMVHLVANALYNNPDAVAAPVRLGLNEFNDKLGTLISQSGRLLNAHAGQENRLFNSGSLFVGGLTRLGGVESPKIRVVGPAYRAAVDAGLRPEVVMANELQERRLRTADELIQSGDALSAYYTRWREDAVAKDVADNHAAVIAAVNSVMVQAISKLDADGLADAGIDELSERLHHILDEEREQNNCLRTIVREVVTGVMYPNTGVREYLRILDRVGSERPELVENPREAAVIALIEYVTIWTTTQFLVMDEAAYQAAMATDA